MNENVKDNSTDGSDSAAGSDSTASRAKSILDIDGLDVTFSTDGGDVHAVKNVTLSVTPGRCWPSWANPAPARP